MMPTTEVAQLLLGGGALAVTASLASAPVAGIRPAVVSTLAAEAIVALVGDALSVVLHAPELLWTSALFLAWGLTSLAWAAAKRSFDATYVGHYVVAASAAISHALLSSTP